MLLLTRSFPSPLKRRMPRHGTKIPGGFIVVGLIVAALFVQVLTVAPQFAPTGSAPDKAQSKFTASDLAKQPLSFEANEGQFDPQVKYLARGKDYNLFLTANEVVFGLNKPKPAPQSGDNEQHANPQELLAQASPQQAESTLPVGVRMTFKGSNAQPRLEYGVGP